jgi:2'-5' RNA ligase
VAARIEGTGIVLERRRFDPHLTLGRWRNSRPTDRRRVLELDRQTVVARLLVDHVTLFESQLGPAGPTHTAVTRATLT